MEGVLNLADYLRKDFAYNAWANHEVLAAIRSSGGENTRSLQLMAHILAAERVWLGRLFNGAEGWGEYPLTAVDGAHSGGGAGMAGAASTSAAERAGLAGPQLVAVRGRGRQT